MTRPLVAEPTSIAHEPSRRILADLLMVLVACGFGAWGAVLVEEPVLDAHPTSADWSQALVIGCLCLAPIIALVAIVTVRARRRGQTTLRAVLGVALVAVGFLGVPIGLLAAGYGAVGWGLGYLAAGVGAIWGGGRVLRASRA